MKNKTLFYSFLVMILTSVLTSGCKKENPVKLPELSTTRLTKITSTSVISGGSVTQDGGEIVSTRGVCWSTHFNPVVSDNCTTDGAGAGSFSSSVTGLTSGTNYYVRAYATNSEGTAYGNEIIFITPLTDIEGNVYNTVIMGTQVWMTENLKTTKYIDKTKIPNVTDSKTWGTLSTPAYCWYNNDVSSGKQNYGALYNWFAVNTGNLCPTGWHVPSEKEWLTLADYLDGETIAGGKLKEIGLIHWKEENVGASNDFGFTALPGGYRTGLSSGSFRANGYLGYWWASTENDSIGARARLMTYDASDIFRGTGLKKNGYSVRCIKD